MFLTCHRLIIRGDYIEQFNKLFMKKADISILQKSGHFYLVLTKTGLSLKHASELTHTMYEAEYLLPDSKRIEKTLLKMDEEQQLLYGTISK